MPERKLDWRNPRPDLRNTQFPIRSLLQVAADRSRAKAWAGPYVRLDQGREGACVGFGWTTELMSTPVRVRPPGYSVSSSGTEAANQFASGIYHAAQAIDEWPGEDYDGTSVLAGAKIVRSRGFIEGYRWAFSIDDVVDSVILNGPVVIGVPWFESMYYTDDRGLVEVSGDLVGGHCLTLTGYYPTYPGTNGKPVLRWRNSWGTSYGVDGDGFIRLSDLDALLTGTPETGEGEACVPVGRLLPAA